MLWQHANGSTGLVANDKMGEGVYTMVDPKTGRQVIDSHTGQALYGGQVGTGKNFSLNSKIIQHLIQYLNFVHQIHHLQEFLEM